MNNNEIVKEILEMVKNGDSDKIEAFIRENKTEQSAMPDDLVRRHDVYDMLSVLFYDLDDKGGSEDYDIGWCASTDAAIEYLREIPSAGSCADEQDCTSSEDEDDYARENDIIRKQDCRSWSQKYKDITTVFNNISMERTSIIARAIDSPYGRAIIVTDFFEDKSSEILRLKNFGYSIIPLHFDNINQTISQTAICTGSYLVYRGNMMAYNYLEPNPLSDDDCTVEEFINRCRPIIGLGMALFNVSIIGTERVCFCEDGDALYRAVKCMEKSMGGLSFVPPVMGYKITHTGGVCKDVQYEENTLYESDYSPILHHRGFHFSKSLETLKHWYKRPCMNDEIYLVQTTEDGLVSNGNICATNHLYISKKIGTYEEIFSEYV